ncbi:MAG: hypothetical protein ACEQSA_04755 [Weeksellaceae bacterium]
MKKTAIQYPDFQKLDIRVGLVTDAIKVEGSSKLLELTVDLGEDYGTVTVFTGMQKWFTPEDFKNKKFYFLANLEPKQMMGKESRGMLMAPDQAGSPVLVALPDELTPGTVVI